MYATRLSLQKITEFLSTQKFGTKKLNAKCNDHYLYICSRLIKYRTKSIDIDEVLSPTINLIQCCRNACACDKDYRSLVSTWQKVGWFACDFCQYRPTSSTTCTIFPCPKKASGFLVACDKCRGEIVDNVDKFTGILEEREYKRSVHRLFLVLQLVNHVDINVVDLINYALVQV